MLEEKLLDEILKEATIITYADKNASKNARCASLIQWGEKCKDKILINIFCPAFSFHENYCCPLCLWMK